MAIEHMGGTKEVRHCRDSLCFARFRILLRHGTSQVGRSRLPTVPTCGPPLRTWRRAAPRLALRARCRGAVRQSVGEGPPAAGADVRRRAAAAVPLVASQLHTTVGKHVNRLEQTDSRGAERRLHLFGAAFLQENGAGELTQGSLCVPFRSSSPDVEISIVALSLGMPPAATAFDALDSRPIQSSQAKSFLLTLGRDLFRPALFRTEAS